MKYVISWNERPQGSPAEYENAQKWASGVGTCWWTATIRWRCTSFARCSLHLKWRHAR